MSILRNSLGVVLGIASALVVITLGIRLNSSWIEYDYKQFPYEHWNRVIKYAARTPEIKEEFFLALLFSCGFGAMIGGLVAALIVKRAKIAYAVLVGFILFIIALLDVIFTPNHPLWYELSIMPVLFFFSWLGGVVVNFIMSKFGCIKL